MLVILGETLISLDNLPETHRFARSPMLWEVSDFFSKFFLFLKDLASVKIEVVITFAGLREV